MSARARQPYAPEISVPRDATYPRIMTGPHPRAVGSFGAEACEWAIERSGMHTRRLSDWRWWQRLVIERALEHDDRGELVWRTVLMSAPRQVGKSYVERAICGWRLHQADWFGEVQDILHLAHKLNAAQEVWRPAARWAAGEYGNGCVRWANGEQKIELPDGSRWMVQAANDGAGVAFSLSMVLVDEAWRVARHVVDSAVAPTMAEAVQPQLWLVSTAGTSESDLMHSYRALALAQELPTEDASLLICEWSAPPDPDLDIADPSVWRSASPYWDDRRAAVVADAFEHSAELAFRQQWLNQWVPTVSAPLFEPSQVEALRWVEPLPRGELALGVEVAADRSHAAIVAYVGGVCEVIESRPGVSWVAGRVAELVDTWQPVGVGIDGTGPAASIADQLRGTAAGDRLIVLTGRQLAVASGRVFDAITDGSLFTVPHPDLVASILGARRRPYGQAWAFARVPGAECSGVLVLALTVAMWAAEHASARVERSRVF